MNRSPLRKLTGLLLAALVTFDLHSVYAQCPNWTFSATCVKCNRAAACTPSSCYPATYGSYTNCGAYDYVQGCRLTTTATMTCKQCDGTSTTGSAYMDACQLGFVCTSGSFCY
jgi:hypothetical protein